MKKKILLLLVFLIGRAAAGELLGDGWHLYAEHHNATLAQTGGVLRIEVRQPSEPFYVTQLSQTLAAPLAVGRKIEFSFQARATAGHTIRALLEQNGQPYFAVASCSPTLGPEWTTYHSGGVTERDWPAGSLGARFQVGQQAGTIELRAIRLEDAGPDARLESAKAALAPDQIAARIARYRMADLHVEVRDAAGLSLIHI